MIVRKKTSVGSSFTKVVVDLRRSILSFGCDLHIDCAEELLRDGSASKDLWGANVYPSEKRIEFTSLINVRPAENNRGMEIQSPDVRKKVEEIIQSLLIL